MGRGLRVKPNRLWAEFTLMERCVDEAASGGYTACVSPEHRGRVDGSN